MILKDTSSTPIVSTCLFYSIKTYFRLKKLGYQPEFAYVGFHFRVYLWTLHSVTQFDFLKFDTKTPDWLFALIHVFIPFRGYEKIIYKEFN